MVEDRTPTAHANGRLVGGAEVRLKQTERSTFGARRWRVRSLGSRDATGGFSPRRSLHGLSDFFSKLRENPDTLHQLPLQTARVRLFELREATEAAYQGHKTGLP